MAAAPPPNSPLAAILAATNPATQPIEDQPEEEASSGKSRTWLYVILGVLGVIVVIVIISVMSSSKPPANPGDDETPPGNGGGTGGEVKAITGNIIFRMSEYEEEKKHADYAYKQYSAPACDLIQKGCINVDEMACADEGLCLKWKEYVLFGRISVPAGVRVIMTWIQTGGWPLNEYCTANSGQHTQVVVDGPTKGKSGADSAGFLKVDDHPYCCFKIEALAGWGCSS